MRHPGTGIGLVPIKGLDGKYLTGLDPEANYIKKMAVSNKEAAEVEKNIVRERLERLQRETGLDLSPRSEYYSGVYGPKFNTGEVASRVKLIDGVNMFNFENPHKEIEFWWVIQHQDLIAPSLAAYENGLTKKDVQFYVSNPEAEEGVKYKKNKQITDAIMSLGKMPIDKQRKVAKLLGLPITVNSKPESVTNMLFDMVNKTVIEAGEYKGQNPITLFNSICAMGDDQLGVRTLVREALDLRVYTKQGAYIYEGRTLISSNEDELVEKLSLKPNQQDRLALEIKVEDKKKMKVGHLL